MPSCEWTLSPYTSSRHLREPKQSRGRTGLGSIGCISALRTRTILLRRNTLPLLGSRPVRSLPPSSHGQLPHHQAGRLSFRLPAPRRSTSRARNMRVFTATACLLAILPLTIAAEVPPHEGRGPHERRNQLRRADASSSASQARSSSAFATPTSTSSAPSKTRTSSISSIASSSAPAFTTSAIVESTPVSYTSFPTATVFGNPEPIAFAAGSACASSYTGGSMVTGTGTLPKPTGFVTKAATSKQLMLNGQPFRIVGPNMCVAWGIRGECVLLMPRGS